MNRKANIGIIIMAVLLVFLAVTFVALGYYVIAKLNTNPSQIAYGKNYTTYSFVDYNNSLNITYERIYPNPDLTQGDILTTDKNIVCVSGYSSTVRDVPLSLRKKVFENYGVEYPAPKGTTELDHFISLSLGGSNSESNLWVEPAPEYKWKDKVEYYLWRKVCKDNAMTIEEAQRLIRTDWYAIYLKINNSEPEPTENYD